MAMGFPPHCGLTSSSVSGKGRVDLIRTSFDDSGGIPVAFATVKEKIGDDGDLELMEGA